VNPDHAWIAAHIPHQGSMCLLDAVEEWDAVQIVCRASSHRLADNPLRSSRMRLGIIAGVEYAAQAMAVHGALLAEDDAAPCIGFLTSVRDVRWHRSRLDDLSCDLRIRAGLISANANSMLYHFTVQAADAQLLSGRASVMLKAPDAGAL
jgi:predicted hotdog family 3-hydroxylacyl-ACP dehydratase